MWLVIIVMVLLLVCVFLLANSPPKGADRDTIFGLDHEPDEKGTKTPEK